MHIRDQKKRAALIAQCLVVVPLIAVVLTVMPIGCTSASVINDVNNMLRDVGAGVVGGHYAGATQKVSPNNHKIIDSDEDNSIDGEGEGDETSVELLRFVDDDDVDGIIKMPASTARPVSTATTTTRAAGAGGKISANDGDAGGDGDVLDSTLSLQDQVRLLTKQLNALMTRRREDYELLERNLRKSLRLTTNAATVDLDIHNELEQLRHEVKVLRDSHLNSNKERLTIEWLQQSVAELRKQLVELQQMASEASTTVNRRTQGYEDLATVRSDFQQLKLELSALRERQEQHAVYVQELREEALQQEEDFKRLLHNKHIAAKQDSAERAAASNSQSVELSTESLADHKRRHCRFQRQQIHELQLNQRNLKRQLDELKYHRIGERVRSIEIEQHRIADANFNLSRQIASLDKLHSSMLELLEDVEGLQNKMDKNIPELRHEISKLEFSSAQLNSEQSLVREEGKNVARSVQAMAVSVGTLQDEREGIKQMQASVQQLQGNVDRLDSMMQDVQRALIHRRRGENKHHENLAHFAYRTEHHKPTVKETVAAPQHAESLVAKLENVELQYESIINKLPQDCSEVATTTEGLYMIAPALQHRPLMARCTNDGWTLVQRRFDGSADFNRSWEDYAAGFGSPSGEYWIGNEQLHQLTGNNCTSLRVLMQDIYNSTWLAEYSNFYISSRADGYRLHISGYSGNASDALDYQQGMQFSAIDVDRDISQTHCAANYEGGWWFSHCQHANLNGRYNLGLTWFDASRNEWIAVKSSQMLVKRHAADRCADVSATTILSSKSSTSSAPV